MRTQLLSITIGFGLLTLVLSGCQATQDTINNNTDLVVVENIDDTGSIEKEEVKEKTNVNKNNDAEGDDKMAAEETQIVSITSVGNAFSPTEVTISVGDSVEFSVGSIHNVVEVSQTDWDASRATQKADGFSVDFGGTKTVAFDKPGTYYYVCSPHVALGMKGKIIVE